MLENNLGFSLFLGHLWTSLFRATFNLQLPNLCQIDGLTKTLANFRRLYHFTLIKSMRENVIERDSFKVSISFRDIPLQSLTIVLQIFSYFLPEILILNWDFCFHFFPNSDLVFFSRPLVEINHLMYLEQQHFSNKMAFFVTTYFFHRRQSCFALPIFDEK